MCRRLPPALVATVMFALGGVPATSPAQVNAESLVAESSRRLAAASARSRANLEQLETLRAMALRDTPPDSIVAGSLTLRVPGEPLDAKSRATLQGAVEAAWDSVSRFAGPAAAAIAAATTIEFTRNWSVNPRRVRSTSIGVPGPSGSAHYFGKNPTESESRDAIVALLGSSDAAAMPQSVRAWSSAWTPVAAPTSGNWSETAFNLATSQSSYSRDCLRGTLSACHTILDFNSRAKGDNWRPAYRPPDLRALVASWRTSDPDAQEVVRRCVKELRDEACDIVAAVMNIPAPVPVRAKQLLIAHALSAGGAGSFDRLTSATGTPAEVIAIVAGMPIDQVVAEWQQLLSAAEPKGSAPSAAELATIVAWTLIFGTLATRRRP